MRHLDRLRRFHLKTIGWKNWVLKLLELVKTPNKPNQKSNPNCKNGDQTRTVRPEKSGQSIGLFTQLEEIDIDFRVSGLPHAVVKQAENFRVCELVKKIESHPHREALQADLQRMTSTTHFGDDSKAMIRELGNVELFELCETIPKVQCSQCLLCWNQGMIYYTCGHLSVESESRRKFYKLRLDALYPALRHQNEARHRKSISWPTKRGRDVSKRNLMEFTIVSNEIQ